MTRVAVVVLIATTACGARPRSRAGGSDDEGGGLLARASMQLVLGSDDTQQPHADASPDDGTADGGDTYGGDVYGGLAYGGWSVLPWTYNATIPLLPYSAGRDLKGSVDGTVSWSGPMPSTVLSACGPVAQPMLHVERDRRMADVLVYIERLNVGRAPPAFPAPVGGIVAKHNCAFVPVAQVVSPLPANLTVYGDATRTRVRVTAGNATKIYDLQEAGRIELAAKGGVLEIASVDGHVAPAWVLGVDTPAYAITDDAGRYRIEELAAGTYDITFWQAPIAMVGPDGAFAYGAPIVAHRRVRVDGSKATHLDVVLSPR